ncbi:hypothetical protein BASA60_003046 [Batrachochytrium salamandrivorans]|nr:hypothetical protein BASA60_003046 [Batrachochytrium salamandrivorans]
MRFHYPHLGCSDQYCQWTAFVQFHAYFHDHDYLNAAAAAFAVAIVSAVSGIQFPVSLEQDGQPSLLPACLELIMDSTQIQQLSSVFKKYTLASRAFLRLYENTCTDSVAMVTNYERAALFVDWKVGWEVIAKHGYLIEFADESGNTIKPMRWIRM